jgi:hypothetical protein
MTKVMAQLTSAELLSRQTQHKSRAEPRLHDTQLGANSGV